MDPSVTFRGNKKAQIASVMDQTLTMESVFNNQMARVPTKKIEGEEKNKGRRPWERSLWKSNLKDRG